MIKTSVEKLANSIGFDIANSDDITQSNLLNGFFEGVHNSMNEEQINMQMCYIADKLSTKCAKMIGVLYSFIELKNKP